MKFLLVVPLLLLISSMTTQGKPRILIILSEHMRRSLQRSNTHARPFLNTHAPPFLVTTDGRQRSIQKRSRTSVNIQSFSDGRIGGPVILSILEVGGREFDEYSDLGSERMDYLYNALFEPYDNVRRPTSNATGKVHVRLGLKMSQLIAVHEKAQLMTTSVWLIQRWHDDRIWWDPELFENVTKIYIPADQIWVPDIVLYNNVNFHKYISNSHTKATLYYNGTVSLELPAVLTSVCQIDVKWFPFDRQECSLKFGSWTYDQEALELHHITNDVQDIVEIADDGAVENVLLAVNGIDISEFHQSVEWDVLGVPAKRRNRMYQSCCQDGYPYVDITYYIKIRRKPLFYALSLVIPCMITSFLTGTVFYLPNSSHQKVTFSTFLLVSQSLFLLLLIEIIPTNSMAIPLIAKYIIFTMTVVTASIVLCVVTLNIHYRSESMPRMSRWMRCAFFNILPQVLKMRPPIRMRRHRNVLPPPPVEEQPTTSTQVDRQQSNDHLQDLGNLNLIFNTCYCAVYIAESYHRKEIAAGVRDEWLFVASVVDRILLGIFLCVSFLGTLLILGPCVESYV